MPRRHRPPKRRNAEKIARKREERKAAAETAGIARKALAVAEALGIRGEPVMDEGLSCALFLDGGGVVRDVLRYDEVERKHKFLTGGVASRYEIRQEIIYFLDGMPTERLLRILKDIWRRETDGKSEPSARAETETEERHDEERIDGDSDVAGQVPDP